MTILQFRVISDQEVSALDSTPHSPPVYSDAFTEDDFSNEWWSVREALKERLELFGEEWQLATNEGDFMITESLGDSRWIYVTFVSTRLWRPELVSAVADLLRSLPYDYRVGCVTELNDEELLAQPMVYLVISSHIVLGQAQQGVLGPKGVIWRNADTELQRFGFPITTITENA